MFKSIQILAKVATPPGDDQLGCPEGTSSDEPEPNKWDTWGWLRDGINLIENFTKKKILKSKAQSRSEIFKDTVLVSKRGACMFEDKALYAQNGGAKANIVVNNEVNRFFSQHITL